MSYGKCGARKTWIYFIDVLYYSIDRSKHFIRHSLLLDRFTLSLYVDQGLQRQHRSFPFVRRWGKQKLMTFLLECVLKALSSIVCARYLFKIGSVLTLAGISKRARAIVMQVLVKERRAAGVGCTKGGKK